MAPLTAILPIFLFCSNNTTSGYGFILRQVGDSQALLFLFINSTKFSGSGSIKRPVQFKYLSKYKVLDRVSPSNAPASIKKPFLLFCKIFLIFSAWPIDGSLTSGLDNLYE
uniref:Putative secreted protein n=1 Tax=Panstrongylus lignarius TaxID=156445 RepID=A0A224XQ49_9HEMI